MIGLVRLLYLISNLLVVSAEDIVYPVIIQSRSETSERTLRVSEEIVLKLEKGTILGDSLVFTEVINGHVRHQLMDVKKLKASLYQSSEHMASVTLTEAESGLTVRGTVNSTHGIEPVETAGMASSQGAHRLFVLPKRDHYDDLVDDIIEDVDSIPEERDDDKKKLPAVVKPELYVVTDTSFSKTFNGSKDLQVQYVTRLLNCVNMVFMRMVNPKIQFQLVGIRSLRTSEENHIIKLRQGYVDAKGTSERFKNYTNHTVFPRPADMFLFLVGRTIAGFANNTMKPGITGIGSIASVCLPGKNTAIAEDYPPTYIGFRTIAHELGHILGAHHDGIQAPSSTTGHPGSLSCPHGGGYIMNKGPKVPGPQVFSKCSVEQIRFVLEQRGKDCWDTSESCDFLSENNLLAETLSAESICHRHFGSFHHSGSFRDCVITCKYTKPDGKGLLWEMRFAAPFGFQCDEGSEKACFYGKCQPKSEWRNYFNDSNL